MKPWLLLLGFFFSTSTSRAADAWDYQKDLDQAVNNLAHAVEAAEYEVAHGKNSSWIDFFDLKNNLLPLLKLVGIDSSMLGGTKTSSSESMNNSESIRTSKALMVLFSPTNLVEQSNKRVRFKVTNEFCQALVEEYRDSGFSDKSCNRLVSENKLFVELASKGNGLSFSAYWLDMLLAHLELSSNAVRGMVNATNASKVAAEMQVIDSSDPVAGELGFAFKFSTKEQQAECKEQARACISLIANNMSYQSDFLKFKLHGAGPLHVFLTLNVMADDQNTVELDVGNLHIELDMLAINVDINQLKTTASINPENCILENTSKGEGYVKFLNKQFSLDVPAGQKIEKVCIGKDFCRISPTKLLFKILDMEKLWAEELCLTVNTPGGCLIAPVKPEVQGKICDQSLASFFQDDCRSPFFCLGDVMKKYITRSSDRAGICVKEGQMDVSYKFGQQNENKNCLWLGHFLFSLLVGDCLTE